MIKTKLISRFVPFSLNAEKQYHPELDGLRGLSILLVFVSHYGLPIMPGAFGVTIFFFVSGFLITRLLQTELEVEATGKIAYAKFYMRRFLRLAPALLVFIVFFATLWLCLFDVFMPSSISAAIFYYFNYHEIFAEEVFRPYGVLWSLAIEEHFYLIFPVVFVLLKGCSRQLVKALISIITIALVWRFCVFFWINSGQSDWSFVYLKKASDTRMDAIAFGCLLAVMASYEGTKGLLQQIQTIKFGIAGMLLVLIGLAFKLPYWSEIPLIHGFQYTLRYSFTGVGLFLLLNFMLFSDKAHQCRALLARPFLVYIGKISYSLYLWHRAILVTVATLYPNIPRTNLYIVCGFISLIVASLSYHLIELKFLALRRKFGSVIRAD